jgi:dTDP-4-dehydrorhamnose reductase
MSWLVFGGTGQLGLTLQDQLRLEAIDFLAPNRKNLDLTSETDVAQCITSSKPSVIINCAAWTNVNAAENNEKEALEINGYAVEYIAKYAKRAGSVLIHISTDYVFSGERDTPWGETDTPDPKTAYGRTKFFGEQALLDTYKENSYILRTAWLYSKYGKNFAKSISERVLNRTESISVVGDQVGQPTLADDLSRQIILVAKKRIFPGIYHGTNSGEASWYDFASEINSILGGLSERVIKVSSEEIVSAAKRPSYSVLSHDKWDAVEIARMRDWKLALKDSIKGIVNFSNNQGE